MYKTYTMRLKTTRKQGVMLDSLLAQLCELYNMALQQRRDVWKSHHKYISFYDQSRQLTELREGVEEYRNFPTVAQRDPLRRLDRAFSDFFRRVKTGHKPGYPRFKPYGSYNSFSIPRTDFRYEGGSVRITRLGTFRIKTSFRVKGRPLQLRIKRLGNKWVAKLLCDIGKAPDKTPVKAAVGMDLGITSLATLSNGTEISNPRWIKHGEARLARVNRSFSSKKRGSKNRAKAKEMMRRAYQRLVGRRRHYLHQVSSYLVNNYDLIAYEELRIKEMGQSGMTKSIMDAAWGELIRQIVYKAEWAGKHAVAVNPRNTTKACSGCGTLVTKSLSERQHNCIDCGLSIGRDHNAALNILALGMSAASKAECVPST